MNDSHGLFRLLNLLPENEILKKHQKIFFWIPSFEKQ